MPSSPTSSSSTNWLRAASSSPVPPYQLRALVLEYLCHNCYTETAKCFARDSAVRHLNADGDEVKLDEAAQPQNACNELSEELLQQIQLRECIRILILGGHIEEATTLLNEHFPSVLSDSESDDPGPSSWTPHILSNTAYAPSTSVDPSHQSLNLRIQSFIEACRTVPLDYEPNTPKPHSSGRSSSSDDEREESTPKAETMSLEPRGEEPKSHEEKIELLSRARKLRAIVDALPDAGDRELYIKELANVGGLLAYRIPEDNVSIVRYLSQERREAVADQIDCAILNRAGFPPISSLELLVRYVTVLWTSAHRASVRPRPGAQLPPTIGPHKDPEVVPPFDLHHFVTKTTS